MITIGTAKWTTESAREVGKRFIELTPLPDFIRMEGPYTYPDGNDGITSITIFKYDKSNCGEANGAIGNLYIGFYGVPGFRYSLKLAAGSKATMKMMGFE
ncbi:MAG: hypothetical protein QNJ22_23130 [Desulfosarcinaceae bacterium]|nr:hypothetical protein [Desulfosarcinaceae bacterium]